ncbi:MAG: pentapeptide repeat-containing protein [Rhizonema sp. PD37]|nr:pentapeptide repeat-containing protein [Rhizonema sp. PD37]
MNSSTNIQEQQRQFLEATATQYSFTGDTRTVFLSRFCEENLRKDNTTLAGFIAWSRQPEDGAQKVQDELKKICAALIEVGCPINQPTKGRQRKGNSPWEQASKWLWETKFSEWQQKENIGSIDIYLETEIQPEPDKKIFDETEITFRDLYVPLKVRLLDGSGNPIEEERLIELEKWAEEILNHKDKDKKILFIQGDAGRGKSVFCRMFADSVRQNWHPKQNSHPAFTPIVIRLRHLKVLENSLTKTFENYLESYDFVKNPSWLTDKNIRFLFFLDGFDELLLQGGASSGIKEFLQQVEHFQRSSHHRFIVTGRPLALQGIDRLITQTQSLERAKIQLMDKTIRQTWLEKWAVKVGQEEANKFQQFLDSCPTDIKDKLAGEPLLLYLLARMHREQRLNVEMFAEVEGIKAKLRIYDESVQWVLQKQRQDENLRLTGLNEDDLRSALTEAALCIVQSGNESAKVAMLESRLQDNHNPTAEAIQQARKKIKDEEKFFNNLLTSFYIKPASGDKEGSVEFVHKSFGEFLFAERLKESILDWTRRKATKRQREDYSTSTSEMNKQIYDLLGYGQLTHEIVDYLMILLTEDEEFKLIELFERLEHFYECWCDGQFIDAVTENLPQSKMQSLKEQLREREIQLGLRQVDMYAGLNVMILLLELHRHAKSQESEIDKIVFHPCGKEDSFDNEKLLRVIGCSYCISISAFTEITRFFFSDANLRGANLTDANLRGANLRGANLSGAYLEDAYLEDAYLEGADLEGANLRGANLRGADLSGADLSGADLEGANLSGANLSGANLSGVDLSHDNLRGADLSGADLEGANLSGAYLSGAYLEDAYLRGANLSGANLDGVKDIILGQVKLAENWEKANYDEEFHVQLGLLPKSSK